MTAKMTSRQRLWAAIEGNPVDRVPVSPRIWRYGVWKGLSELQLAEKFGYDLFIFNGYPLGNALGDVLCEEIGPKISNVKIDISTEHNDRKTTIRRTFHTPGGVLRDIAVQPDRGGEFGICPNPDWVEPLVKTADDVELLPYLLPDPEFVKEGFSQLRELEQEIGDRGLVANRPTMGVDQFVVDALGPMQALISSLDNPQMLARAIELVEEWHIAAMKLALEDGWKIIFDAFYNFSLSVGWSPDFYHQTVAPLIKAHAELIHSYGAKMIFYDDGKQADSIGFVIDAGADMIQTLTPEPEGDLNYNELAAKYGGTVTLNGGVSTVKIRFGTPQEIAQLTRDAIDALAPTGRFILGTSDSITEGTPEENMRAFFDTAREYGQIAINRL